MVANLMAGVSGYGLMLASGPSLNLAFEWVTVWQHCWLDGAGRVPLCPRSA